jgi:hypothetical protein
VTRLPRTLVAMLVLAALGTALAPTAQASGTRLTATLKATAAFPSVTGKGTYRNESGRRELEVEIEHARALHGRRLVVFVGGTRVGTMLVGKLGTARLTRSTQLGQAVPRVRAGTRMSVHTTAGAAVATGRF